jgi:3-deoxy-D-manno-octulosonate 8-phosphate phosphatase (KDO 8-P phosphatase)
MPIRAYSDDVLARAAKIRLACFDVDGTLTDGRLYIDDTGRESKAFHVHDGLGLSLLRRSGVEIAFITARAGNVAERRGAELGVRVFVGVKDKRVCVAELCAALGIAADEVAFMGDDLADLTALDAAGLSVAPANAHPYIVDRVHWRTIARGGEGAARELCDLLLTARGKLDAILAGDPMSSARDATQ